MMGKLSYRLLLRGLFFGTCFTSLSEVVVGHGCLSFGVVVVRALHIGQSVFAGNGIASHIPFGMQDAGLPKPPPLNVTFAADVSLNRTPRARVPSEMMTPIIQKASKHPQIPIESLKIALST
jgi:hypothetical protein